MATVKSNIWNLQVGDTISFTNYVNSFVVIKVGRVEEKSWYRVNGGRSSYGTLASFQKAFPDFTITRQ